MCSVHLGSGPRVRSDALIRMNFISSQIMNEFKYLNALSSVKSVESLHLISFLLVWLAGLGT